MSTSHWLNNAKSEPKRNAIQRCKRETKAIRKAEGDERDILFFRPPQSKTPNPNFFTLLSPKIPHFLCSKPHLFFSFFLFLGFVLAVEFHGVPRCFPFSMPLPPLSKTQQPLSTRCILLRCFNFNCIRSLSLSQFLYEFL